VGIARIVSLPDAAPKTLTVLGCTGSIGKSALALVRVHPQRFRIRALTAHANLEELVKLALEFRPEIAVIGLEEHFDALKAALAGSGVQAAAGEAALAEAASRPCDITLAAIVGAAGLLPTLAAIRRGGTVALANKECLVCAGDLVMRAVQRNNARLIPVDSEHSAIFQLFDFERPETVEKIILTASGGPFRTLTREQMRDVTPEQAVRHPNWSMGAKISVDSATMMNKGLEIIEAHHLFPVSESRIEVVVHPESVIHGMVAYADGSVLAQMGAPDMTTPIALAFAWPQRMETPTPRLDWTKLSSLTFFAPDTERFPALGLARAALKTGKTAPCILNAANEVAVAHFLKGKIGFLQIPAIIERTLSRLAPAAADTLEDILQVDAESRSLAAQLAGAS
jgi:1-deoxy-D-xylulose-5-phosphate reductoisomerase